MKVKVVNKKRFLLIIVVLILLIYIILKLFQVLGSGKSNDDDMKAITSSKNSSSQKRIPLISTNDGNIVLNENEYFKKYIISHDSEITKVTFDEDEDFINITLKENLSPKLDLLTFKAADKDQIFRHMGTEGNVISIKKLFSENNFVKLDAKDKKNIVVLVSKKDNPYKNKVFLDPGHGGVDKGANKGIIYEKDIVFKIVSYMVDDLIYNGCDVKLSRTGDELNKLLDIAEMGNKMKADVQISVHVNENSDSSCTGISTYYTDNGNYTADRLKLAKTIQKHAIIEGGWKDMGVIKDKLKVMSYSKIPCALIECGFLSNPSDREKLTNEKALITLSKNLANGILDFLRN